MRETERRNAVVQVYKLWEMVQVVRVRGVPSVQVRDGKYLQGRYISTGITINNILKQY